MDTPSRELVVGHLSLEFAAGTTTQTQRSKIDITIQPIQVVRYICSIWKLLPKSGQNEDEI